MRRFCFVFVLLLFSGCALTPLTVPHTGDTLGKGNNQWALRYGHGSSISYTRGVTDTVDIGLVVEQSLLSNMWGLQGKWLLNPESRSFSPRAFIYGAGMGTFSTWGYMGMTQSFKPLHWYEIAFTPRLNLVYWNFGKSDRIEGEDLLDSLFTDAINTGLEEANGLHTSISLDVSNTIWFHKQVGLTLSAAAVLFFDSEVYEESVAAPFLGARLHFNY